METSSAYDYRKYIEDRGIDNLSPIEFFRFFEFTYNQRDFAGQEYRKLIALVTQSSPSKGATLLYKFKAQKSQISLYWNEKQEKEKQVAHALAVKDEGRSQVLGAVKSVTKDTLSVYEGQEHHNATFQQESNTLRELTKDFPAPGPSLTSTIQKAGETSKSLSESSTAKRKAKDVSEFSEGTPPEPLTTKRRASIAEPWLGLMQHIRSRLKGGPVTDIIEWSNPLTKHHQMLYDYMYDRLTQEAPLSQVEEKDIFVALSGIVNPRMQNAHKHFDSDFMKKIKICCFRPDFSDPGTIPGLEDTLKPICEAFSDNGITGLINQVEKMIGEDASARQATNQPTPAIRQATLDLIRHM
ncbi:hypothetical protein BGZ79_008104 [Entomortierella chlamydospora]|nr:hypothetical protein BGZ79_008104 [Entomortierella chlamydospora]